MATLLVGANLPDLDAFAYALDDTTALAFRRGWTHGVLAMAVLPAALAGAMMAWDRLVRRRRRQGGEAARFGPLLLLAAISVLSHPLLDFLNTYGVRFLMPFSGRWFYGDALFIVDPWIWIALAAGVFLSRWRRRRRLRSQSPAALALAASAGYVLLMLGSGLAGRRFAAGEARRSGLAVERLMVGPVRVDPFRRMVLLDLGDRYLYGWLELRSLPHVTLSGPEVPKQSERGAARAAARTPEGRRFLTWSRFPAFSVEETPAAHRVRILDARYPGRSGFWASVTVEVPVSTHR
jgi:inner membrane protein